VDMTEGYEIDIYATETGKEPFVEWEDSLDVQTIAKIEARLARIRSGGNLGDYNTVNDGVFELRFDFGPGYRVYFGFGKNKKQLIILLAGGSKRHQSKDIKKAKEYWHNHLSRDRRKT